MLEPSAPGSQDGYFALIVEPPARTEQQAIVPREYLFVLDVSGSMNGFPLAVSKRLMRRLFAGLRPQDRFDILTFAGGNTLLSPAPLTATSENIGRGSDFLSAQQSWGGTELLPALRQVLSLPQQDDTSRTIVVLTDGFVDVEAETFELIRRSQGKSNLFAFGMGSSVNRFLIGWRAPARANRSSPSIMKRRRCSRRSDS